MAKDELKISEYYLNKIGQINIRCNSCTLGHNLQNPNEH